MINFRGFINFTELDFGCECPKLSSPPQLSVVDLTCPGFLMCPLRILQQLRLPWCAIIKFHELILHVLHVTVQSNISYHLWFADNKKLPFFRLILMAILSCVPNSSNKKHRFESYKSPKTVSMVHSSPNFGYTTFKNSHPFTPPWTHQAHPCQCPLSLFLRQGGDVL